MLVQISKLESEVEIDFDSLPEKSKGYVIAYGLKQCLNDAIAAKDETRDDTVEKLNNRIQALKDGSVGIRAAATPKDPLAAMAMQIARKIVAKKLSRKDNPEAFDAKVLEVSKMQPIIEAATKALAATQGLEIEI